LTYLHELTERHAENYMGTVKLAGLTERTQGAHLKFLRSFFRVLKNQAGIVENPFFGNLTVPELQTQSKEAFTPEELKQIAEAATGDWRYLVGIGIYTGLRLTDAVHLKYENITDRITVRPEKLARRKRGDRGLVEIPIHPALAGLLAELKRKRRGKATAICSRRWWRSTKPTVPRCPGNSGTCWMLRHRNHRDSDGRAEAQGIPARLPQPAAFIRELVRGCWRTTGHHTAPWGIRRRKSHRSTAMS
jgi:integrase